MTMTYKIQDSALSHAFTLSSLQLSPPHTHISSVARKRTCEQCNFDKTHLRSDTNIHSMRPVSAHLPSPPPPPPPPPFQCTVLHFVSSDYRSLQSCSRSALVATTKTRRPKPCDRWAHVVRRCPAKCRQHSSVCGLVAAQMFACVLR